MRQQTAAARPGLTLSDIVVIVVLVLTALGLLFTYIVRQRETAMRVQCADNLRRLGTGVRTFHDASGSGAIIPALSYLPAARIADGYATWAVQIAPHVAGGSPLASWDVRQSYFAQPAGVREAVVPTFFCPARLRVRTTLVSRAGDIDPDSRKDLPGALGDYAGVAGNGDPAHDWTGQDANGPIILGDTLKKEDAQILQWRGRVRLDDLKRGLSYTLVLGEKHVPPDGLSQADFGDSSLYNGALPASCTRIGGPGHGVAREPIAPYRINFGSYHPGICLFAQADTAVRVVAVDIGEDLLGKLTTRE